MKRPKGLSVIKINLMFNSLNVHVATVYSKNITEFSNIKVINENIYISVAPFNVQDGSFQVFIDTPLCLIEHTLYFEISNG